MNATVQQRLILPIALTAMVIALLLPFDRGIQAMAGGHVGLHALLVGMVALAGGWFAQRAGLGFALHLRVGLCWALAMALYVLVIDFGLMRQAMPADALLYAHQPLIGRLAVFMARAFNESVIYRLFLFGGMIAGLRALRSGRALPPWLVLVAALIAQLANIAINLGLGQAASAPGPIGAALMLYWLLRYVLPGVVWGWLYWRHGFMTTEVASTGVHLVLQPLLGLLV